MICVGAWQSSIACDTPLQGTIMETDVGAICIPNIGPQERRKRMAFGLVALVVGIIIGLLLLASGAGQGWRLVLFLPFWSAGVGIFQAREKT